jgi:hypothetical protein
VSGAALVLTLLSVLVAKTSWRRRQVTRTKTEISQLKQMQTQIGEVLIAKKGKIVEYCVDRSLTPVRTVRPILQADCARR